MTEKTDDLLQALISVTGRAAFPENVLRGLVGSSGASGKQQKAYNLCDGTRSQADIVKAVGFDSSNFSKTVQRCVDLGIVFRLGEDKHLLHLYSLSEAAGNARAK